jgi:hypothetical protein
MPFKIETIPSKGHSGTTIYTVTVTIDGQVPASRTFQSKGDAERFQNQEKSRLLGSKDA